MFPKLILFLQIFFSLVRMSQFRTFSSSISTSPRWNFRTPITPRMLSYCVISCTYLFHWHRSLSVSSIAAAMKNKIQNDLKLLAINNYRIFFCFVPLLHSIDQRPSAARCSDAIAQSTSTRYTFCHFSIHF